MTLCVYHTYQLSELDRANSRGKMEKEFAAERATIEAETRRCSGCNL